MMTLPPVRRASARHHNTHKHTTSSLTVSTIGKSGLQHGRRSRWIHCPSAPQLSQVGLPKQTDYNVDTCSNHGFTHLHLKSSWICLSTEQLTTGSSNWNRRTVDLFPVSEADLTTQSFWALEVVEVFKLVLSILLVCLETALYRSGPTSSWTKSAVTQFTVALWHESDQRVVLCFVQSARCIPQLKSK